MISSNVPIDGCSCFDCTTARDERAKAAARMAERARTYSAPYQDGPTHNYAGRLIGGSLVNNAAYPDEVRADPRNYAANRPEPVAEPVYTHVLIDCYLDGDMMGDSAEPHTAESLLEAIEARKDLEGRYQVYKLDLEGRYQVYKLGTLILDVSEE